jgi:hypothetical protein
MANAVLYGFINLKDVWTERLININVADVNTAIQASVDEHNRQMDALLGLFARRTTDHQLRYKLPGAHRLQPLDENGRARPVKPAGYYDVAWPLVDAGTAWGANYKSLAKMTVDDANRVTAEMLKADKIWVRDQMLAALFASASYTYNDPAYGALTVQPLANGDAVTYSRSGATVLSTDTHQLATASAVADVTDPVAGIVAELNEHPENDGDVIILVPSNLKSNFTALASFSAFVDPNLRDGANTRTVAGSGPGVAVPGEVLGYHDEKAWIVEWKGLPDNYVIATTANAEPALAMREEPEAELQGFKKVGERNDHPFYENQWARFAGFGAWNRVGALVYRFGNGTYAVPTGYTPPIA